MTKAPKIIIRIISIILLVFAIVWAAILTFQVMVGDPTATLTAAEKLRMTIIYSNIALILAMGILTFFSQHRVVFIADLILAIIGIIFWIAFWWEIISIINIVFLLITVLFDYWQFASNKNESKVGLK